MFLIDSIILKIIYYEGVGVTIYHSNMASVKYERGEIDPFPILVSYYGMSPNWEKPWYASKVMLDSGAFSAANKGIEIEVDDLIEFYQRRGDEFDVLVGLDVINDVGATWRNYRRMQKAGLDVLPTLHFLPGTSGRTGVNRGLLDRYVDVGATHIGIGGVAKRGKITQSRFIDWVFDAYPDSSKVGFHGFGIVDPSIMLKYPWRSVDATSIHIQARYGGVYTSWGWVKIGLNVSPKEKPRFRKILPEILEELEGLGVDVEKARGPYDPARHRDFLSPPLVLPKRGSTDVQLARANSEAIKERCRASLLRFEILAKDAPPKWIPGQESLLA